MIIWYFLRELQSDNRLGEILQNQDVHRAELMVALQQDADLQKAAVGTLLERGDARSWGLVQQVQLVEAQLSALTLIEMDRRKLEMDYQMVCVYSCFLLILFLCVGLLAYL